jgi:hypothetical protein
MRKNIRIIAILLGSCYLQSVVACSSAQRLTPATAKQMLEEYFRTEAKNILSFDYSDVAKLPGRKNFEDAKKGVYKPDTFEATVQRLVNAGFMDQQVETLTLSDLTGNYQWQARNAPMSRATLSIHQGSPMVSGTFQAFREGYGTNEPPVLGCEGNLFGHVNVNGTVSLSFKATRVPGGCSMPSEGETLTYTVSRKDDSVSLTDLDRNRSLDLKGHSTGGQVTVPVYNYTFTSNFRKFTVTPGYNLRAGTVVVDSVERLLLGPTDTRAEAEFRWHATFNDAARAFSGKSENHGVGRVEYGKQPDGSWILTYAHL